MEVYITVVTGLLLVISESLPFISKIKGNGLLQVLATLGKKVIHNPENERFLPIIDNLGNIIGNNEGNNEGIASIQSKNNIQIFNDNPEDNLVDGSLNNNSNVQGDLFLFIKQAIKDIKDILMTHEKGRSNDNKKNINQLCIKQNPCNILLRPNDYELEYISNFIKCNYPIRNFNIKILSKETIDVLKSLNYIINYDSENDIYNIKW